MNKPALFREELRLNFDTAIHQLSVEYPKTDILRIDLHCHDRNSDVPDELWGRILKLPETWLKPKDLLKCLRKNSTNAWTITNHNNARSCWEMLEKGHDVLPGAEFTCLFPEYNTWIHVLVYGFDPIQEHQLDLARRNIYNFLRLCREWNLPVVQPHPLYFYAKDKQPPIEIFEKFALLFERFEVLNGQRELWQNSVTLDYVRSLDEEKILVWEKKHKLKADDFCSMPYQKRLCGGSDDHFGVFAGSTGTLLYIPDLEDKIGRGAKTSELALDALRYGQMAPYGKVADEEKLTAAFLDYFAQCTLNAKDPGLLRMMLHQGSLEDKLWCLGISNGLAELKRHKVTTRFLEAWSLALKGEKPGFLTKMATPKDYKPILAGLENLALTRKKNPEQTSAALKAIFSSMSEQVSKLMLERGQKQMFPMIAKWQEDREDQRSLDLDDWISHLEVPSHFRTLFGKDKPKQKQKGISQLNLGKTLDQLQFPALIGAVLGAATLGSTRSLFASRETINQVAKEFGGQEFPKRWLWLSDTFGDKNGVSSVLREILTQIQKQNLPIDILVSSDTLHSEDNLIVIPTMGTFKIPGIESQEFRLPDLLQVHRTFFEGSYSSVICSTELLMGPIALFLKHAFHVPAHFYMHTDWISYLESNSKLDIHGINRARRILRSFYQQFDNIFVLNSEHKQWLAGESMGLAPHKIHTTAHWPAPAFKSKKKSLRPIISKTSDEARIMLFSGRLSTEKGVEDIVKVWKMVRNELPETQLVFAGTGPAESTLRQIAPEAHFVGWLPQEQLAQLYCESDVLVFPSRFDTFGCSVVEAMSCGLPVIAYASKGPADLIEDGICGFLCEEPKSMSRAAIDLLSQPALLKKLRRGAMARAMAFSPDIIMKNFMNDLQKGHLD